VSRGAAAFDRGVGAGLRGLARGRIGQRDAHDSRQRGGRQAIRAGCRHRAEVAGTVRLWGWRGWELREGWSALLPAADLRPIGRVGTEARTGGRCRDRRRRQGGESTACGARSATAFELAQPLDHLAALAFHFAVALGELARLLLDRAQLGVGLPTPGIARIDLGAGRQDVGRLGLGLAFGGGLGAGERHREHRADDDHRADSCQQQVLAALDGHRTGNGLSHRSCAPGSRRGWWPRPGAGWAAPG
jgi:hypothetical protein